MSSFLSQLKAFNITTKKAVNDAFLFATTEVRRSVTVGSEVTGAPGQPVQTGNLRSSWVGDFEGPTSWLLSTNVTYAVYIEDGGNAYGPFTLRSQVGGFHSVKLTVAAWPSIIELAALMAGGTPQNGP